MNDIVLKRDHQLERENNLDFSNRVLETDALGWKYLSNSYDVRIIELTDPNWIQDVDMLILSNEQNKEIYNIFIHLKNVS